MQVHHPFSRNTLPLPFYAVVQTISPLLRPSQSLSQTLHTRTSFLPLVLPRRPNDFFCTVHVCFNLTGQPVRPFHHPHAVKTTLDIKFRFLDVITRGTTFEIIMIPVSISTYLIYPSTSQVISTRNPKRFASLSIIYFGVVTTPSYSLLAI